MKLFYREKGAGRPVIILHGLWGASDNWLPVGNQLAGDFRVILPDLRNHGQSPHTEEMNYHVMSDDIIELIEALDLPEKPHIIGHSMGGKVVMALLMKQPELVDKAVIVDIAPVSYSTSDGGRHAQIIDFFSSFNLAAYQTRQEVTEAIRRQFRTERSRQLFLKNLKKTADGFAWKINYPVLNRNFHLISGCPENLPRNRYDQEILFIKGERSDLIRNIAVLQKEYPAARLQSIANCGHWIHSEQPDLLTQTIREFILPIQTPS